MYNFGKILTETVLTIVEIPFQIGFLIKDAITNAVYSLNEGMLDAHRSSNQVAAYRRHRGR